jgi:Na+-translocating ferredoxin:NAD+ oxidoreductase RnfC subunit
MAISPARRGRRSDAISSIYYTVAANSTRLWETGETVRSGQFIGATAGLGALVHCASSGRVVGIQHRADKNEIILQVEPY